MAIILANRDVFGSIRSTRAAVKVKIVFQVLFSLEYGSKWLVSRSRDLDSD